MSEPSPGPLPDPHAFRNWKPEAQQRALELIKQRQESNWRPFFCPNRACDGMPHDKWVWNHARADQHPPKWDEDWLTWLISSGRGSGKTRTGAEVTHKVAKHVSRIHLVAPTGPDLRETVVEGISGILETSPPGQKPLWEPSKKKLTWPNGAVALGFSAEEPDRLRGPQCGFAWADEPAFYDDPEAVMDNIRFGLRVKGKMRPKIVLTTTPKPTKWMKETLKDPRTVVTRTSTYANLVNLADEYRQIVLERYEGTRLGKQELLGELLEDVEGALWAWDMIRRSDIAPPLRRIVVAVDPAGTANKRSDETGIVVVGIGYDKVLYVLEDRSGKYTPEKWGSLVNQTYNEFSADAIVPERNYGEDMVKYVLENSGYKGARIIPVRSRRGKAIRAEPIVALYEKRRVIHVGNNLGLLEDEMTSWVPGEGPSPNRVDALVHGLTELAKTTMPTQVSDPRKFLRQSIPSNQRFR